MKNLKVILSTLAVMAAAGSALVTNAAKKINTVTVPVVSDKSTCVQVGRCTIPSTGPIPACKNGTVTLFSKASDLDCLTPASGNFINP